MIVKNIFIRLVQQFLQFLITLLMALYMGPEGYGSFSLFLTNASFLILFLGLNAESAFLYFSAKQKMGINEVLSLSGALMIFQLLGCGFVFFLIPSVFHRHVLHSGFEGISIIYCIIFILSNILFNYFYAFLAGLKEYFTVIFISVIFQVIFVLVMVALHETRSVLAPDIFKPSVLIPAYSGLFFLQAVMTIFYAFKKNKEAISFINPLNTLSPEILRYIKYVYIGNLLQFLAYRMDVWILDYYHPKATVGIYAMAVKVAQLFWLIPQLLSALLFPLTATDHEHVSEMKFKKLVLISFFCTLVCASISTMLYPVFIRLVGNSYSESFIPYLYLLPGIILFSINILIAARLAGQGNVRLNFISASICVSVIVLLDFMLIPSMQAKGAAVATSIAYTVSSIFVVINYFSWRKR